jgi:hypothetical protein
MNASEFGCGAAHQLAITVAKVGWEIADFTTLTQSEEKSAQVLLFLRGEADLIPKTKPAVAAAEPSVTTVLNFSGDFDPVFVGKDWKVLTDTDNGIGIDLTKVRFETCLKEDEAFTTGEERLIRLKTTNHGSLGGKAFKACWENRHLLPDSWKKDENGNTRYIFFDGLVLQSPGGSRCTLYLYWDGGGWDWYYGWLGSDRYANDPSAVLAN